MVGGIRLSLAVCQIGKAILLGLVTMVMIIPNSAGAMSQCFGGGVSPIFTGIDLDPGGYDWAGKSVAYGISSGEQVGWSEKGQYVEGTDALIWHDSRVSVVNLNPIGFTSSEAYGTSGEQQVGVGLTGDHTHALLWRGSADSVVDLNPAGFTDSTAYAVSGAEQVGYGFGPSTGDQHHALLWRGSAGNVVDLNPAGFVFSEAHNISDGHEVGYGFGPTTRGEYHALLWRGTAGSAIDLDPSGFAYSQAFGTSGEQQAGSGSGPATGNNTHALLWHGSAGSVVDLHPSGFSFSQALATFNGRQVGFGIPVTGKWTHALLWCGSAGSVVDLHAFLPSPLSVPHHNSFSHSWATGIDATGDIVGYALLSGFGIPHAVLWRQNAPAGTLGWVMCRAETLLDLPCGDR